MNDNNKKEDARVIRTKRDLADALVELLAEKNFDDLSVKDISDKALIAKNTFYNNFADKNELLSFVMGRYYDVVYRDLKPLLESYRPFPFKRREFFKKTIASIVHFFYEKRLPFDKMVQADHSHALYWALNQLSLQLFETIVAEYPALINKKGDEKITIYFYAGGVSNLIYSMLDEGYRKNEKDLCNEIYRLIYPTVIETPAI